MTIERSILRRATSANWASADPVLAEGELGFEVDTGKMKIGDGVKTWTALDYDLIPILGIVGQSDGVPTGALIERDSNGNGEYVRFADGLQICTYTYTATADAWETVAGALYCMSSAVTWTYPAAFVATPVVVASVKRGTNFPAGVQIVGSTATTADLKPWTAISAATSTVKSLECLAVGRWF